jgi:hypothetical protein
LYLKKYTGRHFDLIIASNTDAFNFLLKNRDEIFPGTPVVFCGVVNFDNKMLDASTVLLVLLRHTMSQALSL